MHEELKRLRALSNLDSEIATLREMRALRPKRERASEKRLGERQDALHALEGKIRALKIACDRAELEIKAQEKKAEDLQVKLNTCRSNEEYQVLRALIAQLAEEIDQAQERTLEDLDRAKAMEGELQVRRAEVEEARREHARIRAEVARELEEIDGRIGDLESRRAGLAEAIDPDNLSLYERLLERYGSASVVPVEDEICQGCHMSVTPQMVSRLMLDRELVRCKTCQRILFLDGDG